MKMRRAAVLWVVLLVLVSAASCRRFALRKQLPDVSCLPADAIVVVSVDTARLRDAPLYKKLDPEPGQVKTFLLHLGINPERDLDQMIFAFRGGTGGEPGEWLAVLKGRFDPARIEKGMEDPASRMSVEIYRRRHVYNLVRVPEIGDLSFAVVDAGAVALGKSGAIQRVLDVKDAAAPSLEKNETMMRLLSGLDPHSQIWAVLDGKELVHFAEQRRQSLSGTVPEPALKNLSSVVDGKLWAVMSEDLAVSLEIGSATEKEARNLADAIRGIVAFAKLGAEGRDPESAALIEAVTVKEMEKGVRVGLKLPGDQVVKLRDRLREAPATPVPAPSR
jgi:hypothetical protein